MGIFTKQKKQRIRPTVTLGKTVSRYTNYYKSEAKINVVKNTTDLQSRNRVVQKRKPTFNVRSLPTYIALLVMGMSIVYVLSLNGSATVVTGSTQGLRPTDYYDSIATKLLQKSFFNKSKLSFDTRKFTNDFLDAVPEAESVTVAVPLVGRTVVLGIAFVKPAYVYEVNSKAYILGSNGVILSEASSSTVATAEPLKKITDSAPLQVSIGQTVLLASDITFIDKVFEELSHTSMPVNTITLPEGAGELYVTLVNTPYIVKFSLLGDAAQQVGAYKATVLQLQSESSAPAEYIDVRLAEKVYVK